MRYFVTGATGFIGGRVANQLCDAGHDVIALVRNPKQAAGLAAMGVQLAPGDVTNRRSIRAAMSECDGVFHIAGWYKVGVKDKRPAIAVNIDGTRNVLDSMKELGIMKGVYTSTLAVNSDTHGQQVDESYKFSGTHLSEYDRTKAEAHDIAKRFIGNGLPLVIVQPGMVYGPGDLGPSHDLLVQFLKRKLLIAPQRTAFCWAHVDDVARGHILAMERGHVGDNYFLAGPVHTLIEVLKLAEQLTGVRAPALSAPPWMLKMMSAMMGLLEQVIPVPASYSGEYLRVSAGVTYTGDNTKAKHQLRWTPRSLEDGLAETLRYEMKLLGMNATD